MKSEKVTIEVWSDIVCPFCFIGKRKMEQAITKLQAEDKVEVVWHSFQLDPDFPKGMSMPSLQYLSERKGYPLDNIEAMSNQLAIQAKEYNIDFKFDQALSFNTIDAHRLLQWSKTLGKSDALKEALMEAYFSEGVNLSQEEKLLAVVEKVGLDTEKAKEVLSTNAHMEEVQRDVYQSRQLGVRGVPFFLINEKETIYGAQADPVFESIIAAALAKLTPTETSSEGGFCLPDGTCQ